MNDSTLGCNLGDGLDYRMSLNMYILFCGGIYRRMRKAGASYMNEEDGAAGGAGAAAGAAARSARAGAATSKRSLHILLNRLDIQKDATEPRVKVENRTLFNKLINTLIHNKEAVIDDSTTYPTKKAIFEAELGKLTDYSVEKVPILRFKKKVLTLPKLYTEDNKLESHSISYGIQDSGKNPRDFDANINTLITPGAYLDPASRENPNATTSSICMSINLNQRDFDSIGLAHIIKGLTIAPLQTNRYKVTITPTDNTYLTSDLTFEIGPSINNLSNTNDNIFLQGNDEKNKYINSNIADETKKHEIYAYCIMKLLGDMLQAYYPAKILTENLRICTKLFTRDDICLFTSDNFLAARCALLEIPCLVEDYSTPTKKSEKASGSDYNVYIYYKYNKSPVQIRMMNMHNGLEMIRACIIKAQRAIDVLKSEGKIVRFESQRYRINTPIGLQPINKYITIVLNLANELLNHIKDPSKTNPDTDIYNLRSINIDSKSAIFRAQLSKYIPTSMFSDKQDVLNVIKIFQGLLSDHPLNSQFQTLIDELGRGKSFRDLLKANTLGQDGGRSFGRNGSLAIVNIPTNGNGTHNITAKRALLKTNHIPQTRKISSKRNIATILKNALRHKIRIPQTRKISSKRNIATIFRTLSTPEQMIKNIDKPDITKTVGEIITVVLTYMGRPSHEYIIEEYLELFVPYYEFMGRTSVNPIFYKEIIPKLDAGDLSFDEFKYIYATVHDITIESINDNTHVFQLGGNKKKLKTLKRMGRAVRRVVRGPHSTNIRRIPSLRRQAENIIRKKEKFNKYMTRRQKKLEETRYRKRMNGYFAAPAVNVAPELYVAPAVNVAPELYVAPAVNVAPELYVAPAVNVAPAIMPTLSELQGLLRKIEIKLAEEIIVTSRGMNEEGGNEEGVSNSNNLNVNGMYRGLYDDEDSGNIANNEGAGSNSMFASNIRKMPGELRATELRATELSTNIMALPEEPRGFGRRPLTNADKRLRNKGRELLGLPPLPRERLGKPNPNGPAGGAGDAAGNGMNEEGTNYNAGGAGDAAGNGMNEEGTNYNADNNGKL